MGMDSGSNLMNYLNMGEVAHTALEDAKNTAIMYLKLLDKFEVKKKNYPSSSVSLSNI